MNRRWFLHKTNAEYVSYLSREASISRPTAQIFINRGIKSPEEVARFLSASVEDLSDPFSIDGISDTIDAIEGAAKDGTRVLVHGDYDADGLTSTAMLVEALRRMGAVVSYFVPNRFKDGYGFNPPAVQTAKGLGAGLIITADCGISSIETARFAAREGIGVIVTDHHEPLMDEASGTPVLPEAIAVVNPKLSGSGLSNLSGAGVVLKLIQGLGLRHPGLISHIEFLDLATLGTLADSVPLTGENRAIATGGMRYIREGLRPGVRALKEVSGLNGRKITSELLSFTLVPRLNAAGRMSDPSEVVELLLSTSTEDSARIADALNSRNAERQRVETVVFEEAMEQLGLKGAGSAIVLSGRDWHEGVIGIVASRIAEKFSKPTFIFSIKGETAKGSARSIPQFDIYGGISRCRDLLMDFGGHNQAAGVKILTTNLDRFEGEISALVESSVKDFTPSLSIDAFVDLRDIRLRLVEEFMRLEPFGYGNPQPVLGTRDVEALSPRIVGNNHLKLRLRSGSSVLDAIGFNMGDMIEMLDSSPMVDVAYHATINEWEGSRSLQLNLKGLRPASQAG